MSESNADKMSSENKESKDELPAENKPSLTTITHKLKAEALRRLKLDEQFEGNGDSDSIDIDDERVGLKTSVARQEFEQGETKESEQELSETEVVAGNHNVNRAIIEQEKNSDLLVNERTANTNIKDNNEERSDTVVDENSIKNTSEQHGTSVSPNIDTITVSGTIEGHLATQETELDDKTHETSVPNLDVGPTNGGSELTGEGHSSFEGNIVHKKPDQIMANDQEGRVQADDTNNVENNSNFSGKLNSSGSQDRPEPQSLHVESINSVDASGDTIESPKDQSQCKDKPLTDQTLVGQLDGEDTKTSNDGFSQGHPDIQDSISVNNANVTTESQENILDITGLQTISDNTTNGGETKANIDSLDSDKTLNQDPADANTETVDPPLLSAGSGTNPDIEKILPPDIVKRNELENDNKQSAFEENNAAVAIDGTTDSLLKDPEHNENEQVENPVSEKSEDKSNSDQDDIDGDEMTSPLKAGDGENMVAGEPTVPGESLDNNDLSPSDGEGNEVDTSLADDFYYEKATSLFKPLLTEGVPQDLLSLHHSFGYECTKRENLHILDTNTVVFSAGNLVQILDLKTMEHTYIGGTNNGGIGAITVHPSRQYFAVAEKGVKPNINIYEYPSLKLFRVLREGTLEAFAHMNFSPHGTKLASLGGSPDFMLTVWDWRNEKVILRSKAFSQDVYKVAFSPENEGHLCTSGSCHIRFWSMANTFTGLKLQGELGRFGTTELTDIEGFVELPDGKVLSGSEWGNMLLWDGGLIKVEICKKGKKLCHNGMIEQFFMDEGELMTIGADGFIKVWDFEGIDNADITDEKSRVFEMEPMYEIKVATDVKLKSMVKSVNPNTPTIWYGQDASGAIWKLDLSFTHTSHAPEKLFSFHAGIITCVEVSPISHLVATCGLDCTVRLYDYLDKLSLCSVKYSSAATSLLWLPKTVDPKCTSILCGFSDGVVRYLSVARDDAPASRNKRNKSSLEFQLVQVFKPHTKSVTSIVLDKRGKMLATGSEDCTVFFFAIEDSCKPIGFIETASPVVSMSWLDNTQDPGGILVFCKDGAVLDVEVPRTGTVDTNKSFRIPLQDLVKREYMFTRVKDKLLKAEEDERQAKIKEEKEKRKEEERKRRRARGIEEDETEEEEEEEEEDEGTKEQDTETIDHGPCVTIRGFPSLSLDKFWMLMDGWDAGYIYECEFSEVPSEDSSVAKEPINAIKLLDCGDAPVRSYTYSNSGDFVLFGMEDGVIRIHPVHGKNVLDSLTTYWAVHLHDSHHGAITAIRTSFDDKYVFTVGTDGNFFVYNFSSDASLKESKPLVESSIPKIKTVIGEDGHEVAETIDDIDDPNYYSIELEKQKAEHDRMVKIAEEKKQNVRRVIAKFRRSFKSILAENQNLPEYLRVRAQELEIDPEIRKQQEAQSSEKIDLARKELAWESEKHTIGLKKLQDRFKSMMECDRIILYACGSSHKVASFRSSKLSELYDSLKESLDSSSKEKNASLGNNQKKMSVAGLKGALTGKRKSTQVDTRKKSLQPTSGGQVGGNVAKALEKAEQRRLKRELRQAEWNALYSNKPDDNYQDPKDLSAIKEASDNMGDYKLKTAGDYVVPEGQRVNAEIKLMQLLQLLDQIHYYKTYFNRRLLVLRDKKMRIIEEVKECVNSLKHLQTKMDPATHKPIPTVPKMKPEELPERKLVYDKEMLYSFKKQLEIKKEKKEEEDDSGGGGFGGFGVSESKPPQSNAGSRDRTFSNVSVLSGGRPKSNQSMRITDQITSEAILENVEEQLTPLEIQLKNQEQIRMKYEQDRLLKRIHFLLTNFDGELKTLRHEKSQFEVTLKNADLRHVTLFEELVLLKEFEKRENIFANRVKIKGNEKQDMEEKVDNCQVKLDIKKEEIEKYQEQEKALYATFSAMIGENNKFDGFLTKVFKKKIKRAKKKDESRDGSEEGSDEDDSDEDFSSSEESNSDEETLDDAVCPPGCDQALFDKVCELRESRLDIEESLTEEKKALEALKKEHEALNKRAKVIDSALSTAESELEAFQREKQQKLNELDVVVTIKLHQIQYIINNAMPQDLSSCLVFISFDHNRLQKRIKELEVEKAEQKRLFREHRQMHVQLKRDKKAREAEISELEEKVKNMQMLKFGRLVDFERLENVSVNRNAEELKERLRQQEFQNATELSKWEKKIQSYREKLTLRTRENTERLNTSTTLFHERQELEQKLDSKQKSLGAEYSGNREADVKERHRLVQLVQLQAQEIDALKDEITLMSRKGGHILPPSQPPLPTSQTAIPNM